MVKRILYVSGGGASGAIYAQVLKRIQGDLLNQPLGQFFDYIVGTSVGSIIGAYIATTPKEKFVDFSRVLRKDFFMRAFNKRQTFFPINLCLTNYHQKNKTDFLKDIFGGLKLKETKIPFGAVAYNISTCSARVFHSTDESDKHLPVHLVCNASSAAPTFFEPIPIYSNHFVDGGVIDNNCALAAYLIGRKTFGVEEMKNTKLLSIGYDQKIEYSEYISSLFKGSVYWISDNRIIDVLMDASSDLNDIICQELMGDRYLRIAERINKIKLDQLDNKTIALCISIGNDWYEKNKDKLYDFFDIKSVPAAVGSSTNLEE